MDTDCYYIVFASSLVTFVLAIFSLKTGFSKLACSTKFSAKGLVMTAMVISFNFSACWYGLFLGLFSAPLVLAVFSVESWLI
ncbi:MAG: hypothetical protein ACJAYB_001368 [Psychromonas sp.]|jgi:hypothetical protein